MVEPSIIELARKHLRDCETKTIAEKAEAEAVANADNARVRWTASREAIIDKIRNSHGGIDVGQLAKAVVGEEAQPVLHEGADAAYFHATFEDMKARKPAMTTPMAGAQPSGRCPACHDALTALLRAQEIDEEDSSLAHSSEEHRSSRVALCHAEDHYQEAKDAHRNGDHAGEGVHTP